MTVRGTVRAAESLARRQGKSHHPHQKEKIKEKRKKEKVAFLPLVEKH